MKILTVILSLIVICLLVIIYNQMQVEEVPIQPVPVAVPTTVPTNPLPRAVTEQPQPHRVLRERIYWQESSEYYHWRTSIKTSIEDARPPEYSGRWITEYYWTYK